MKFYNNYCDVKKAEIYYNGEIKKDLNLYSISKVCNPFLKCFSKTLNQFDDIFNNLISQNTKYNSIVSYSNIEENSEAGLNILSCLSAEGFGELPIVTSIANLTIDENSKTITYSLGQTNIEIKLEPNKISTIVKNGESKKTTISSLTRINGKEYIIESKDTTMVLNHFVTTNKEKSMVNVANRKIEYYSHERISHDSKQKTIYSVFNNKCYITKKSGMHLNFGYAETGNLIFGNINQSQLNVNKSEKPNQKEKKQIIKFNLQVKDLINNALNASSAHPNA